MLGIKKKVTPTEYFKSSCWWRAILNCTNKNKKKNCSSRTLTEPYIIYSRFTRDNNMNRNSSKEDPNA
ncbi:unnamed protein product [Rhizophagus irregularis]|nr:unnamed protein product [Rhizophagus irregularis]